MRLVRYILPSSYVISKCWLQETAHKKEKQFLWSNIDSSSQKRSTWKILSSYLKTLCQFFRWASLIFFHINLHPINVFLRCRIKMFTVPESRYEWDFENIRENFHNEPLLRIFGGRHQIINKTSNILTRVFKRWCWKCC